MKKISVLLFILFSCSPRPIDQVDHNTSFPVKFEELLIYKHYNEFVYQHEIKITRDDEVTTPRHFKIRLPKQILSYEIYDSSNFGFFYRDGETIIIKIDLESKSVDDSLYVATGGQIKGFISGLAFDNKEFNKKFVDNGKKSAVLKKGAAEIALYNIKSDNFDEYLKLVNTFHFLR